MPNVFAVRRCAASAVPRGTTLGPRTDIDMASQANLVRHEAQQRVYNALLAIYTETCADKNSHFVFLRSLIAEAHRYQVAKKEGQTKGHEDSPKRRCLTSKSTAKELQKAVDQLMKPLADPTDPYVDTMSRLASFRMFSEEPRLELLPSA